MSFPDREALVPRVYLAGPIFGRDDAECRAWRQRARRMLTPHCRIADPMDRDYRGQEDANVVAIVQGDIADIKASDAVLVNAERPSWGTAQEMVYARNHGRLVVAWGALHPSPWLRYHADLMVTSLNAACDHLVLWAQRRLA